MAGQNHTIVIGASMGGLLAARALADFYQEVTLIERDAFPPIGENRKGVPQGRHTHALLLRGGEILEGFFPGLTADLMAQGAPFLDRPENELIWFDGGGYHARFTNEDGRNGALMVSRPLLEGYVRQRLLALLNVCAIQQCDALGLVPSERAGRVSGVRLLRRAEGSAEEVLEADLVVDASGRGSRAPKWLEEMGYTPPEEERVTVNLAGVTRLYRRRPEHLNGAKAVIVTLSPERKRGAVMLAQEGERWTLTLIGFAGDAPPQEEEGFLAFARSLAAPEVYEVIKDAKPLSNFLPYRVRANERRRYERLTRFPEGFLVFGDALCSFNPIYGQGMSVAAMEALDLQDELRRGSEGLWRRFFRRAARSIDIPWQIVVSGDLRFPEAEGKRTPAIHFINAYMARLHRAAHRDPVVARAFNDVASLLAPPQSLMRPGILWRVLRG
ncbi:FAD-dependent oxidoreductase [Rhodothermus marinus]|uniref:FAD-dependent oxidoreductase n=1 Tax=Rhodothermus marinus TaxID=29549 RepID=UPI0012BA4429|nr:monooxygenase [Rhodothermus marinus]BBM70373.1 FAD-binding monooxygenase [Rhodothermus marinus]BBM73360.1 FAD-binding monooxygenase [Rhodothermus marinus]